MGLNNIGNIVAGLALRRCMEESEVANPTNFRDSPVNVALIAANLAKQYPEVMSDQAYLLGLFINCGEPLLLQRFPESSGIRQEAYASRSSQAELEDERFNTNHAIIGYLVSKRWGLLKAMSEIILHPHDATEYLRDYIDAPASEHYLMANLKMAEHIDNRFWGRADDSEWDRYQEIVLQNVGLDNDGFEDMLDMLMSS